MPRIGSESTTSTRRHTPTQTLSSYFQLTSEIWQTVSGGLARSSDSCAQARPGSSHEKLGSSHSPHSLSRLDALDDLLSRSRAFKSAPRTRWNIRKPGNPYGPRPLNKWLPSEQKHIDEMSMLMQMFPGPGLDIGDAGDEETVLHETLSESAVGAGKVTVKVKETDERADKGERMGSEDSGKQEVADGALQGECDSKHESELVEVKADDPHRALPHASSHFSSTFTKKQEKNRRKKAKARAKAKDREPPSASDPQSQRDRPQDLLASMSRIAQLVDSLNTNTRTPALSGSGDSTTFPVDTTAALPQLVHASPSQWRAEVLQSVRRMEGMLGQMERWQAQVAPGEIEALRQETARLEVRVRAVVEQKEWEDTEVEVECSASASLELGKATTASESGSQAEVNAGINVQEDDTDSTFNSTPGSNSCPSEGETELTDLDLEEEGHTLQDDKIMAVSPLPPPADTTAAHPVFTVSKVSSPSEPAFAQVPADPDSAPASSSEPSATAAASNGAPATKHTNLNIPPPPPAHPIPFLTSHPWSMLEVLFLLEIVAHFPPAEHGWTFIAEAYNNILITRPLQEWFGKQASAINEEEVGFKALLQKMGKEMRQLRAAAAKAKSPGVDASLSPQAGAKAKEGVAKESSKTKGKAVGRGATAPFGSAAARAEADAHTKSSVVAAATAAPPAAPVDSATVNAGTDAAPCPAPSKDVLFVTRLPYALEPPPPNTSTTADTTTPPPAQRVLFFPRRRPPLTLASSDARTFANVMRSAAAGVRPPSTESRLAMLELFSATKSRFPVRTPWDCWHRWCTPWVVVPSTSEPPSVTEDYPMVLDYIAGNLVLPCGTWITQSGEFMYRVIPGTYPDAPGVQHTISAGYDPRPGMASFARMTHLLAEKVWTSIGIGRLKDGAVTEEALVGRRTKLPSTLAGIWPCKALPPKSRPAAPAPVPLASSTTYQAPADPSTAAALAASPRNTEKRTANPTPAPAPSTKSATPNAPSAKAAKTVPPVTKSASAKVSIATLSSSVTPPSPAARPKPVPTSTIAKPPAPFLPLPSPRKPRPQPVPHVPEGTLGDTIRPGIRPWFYCAAVRADVLERVLGLQNAKRVFEEAFGPAPHSRPLKETDDRESEEGRNDDRTRKEADKNMRAWEREREKERERGRWVPLHLRSLVIPPPPPPLRPSQPVSAGRTAAM